MCPNTFLSSVSLYHLSSSFCCVASATLSSRKCKSTSVCCVPAVLQSVWLVYSASAGVGRLLAGTLWCSAHVISLISLCVCASRWVLDSGSERMWTHTPETHCAHSCLDSTHPKPSLLFPQSASLSPVGFSDLSVCIPLWCKNILIMILSVTVYMLWQQQICKLCCDYYSCLELRVCSNP